MEASNSYPSGLPHDTRNAQTMPVNEEKGVVGDQINVVTDMDEDLVAMAHRAAELEKAMPFKQAIKVFWRGAFWSMMLSLALVMEGYDVGLVSSSGCIQIDEMSDPA